MENAPDKFLITVYISLIKRNVEGSGSRPDITLLFELKRPEVIKNIKYLHRYSSNKINNNDNALCHLSIYLFASLYNEQNNALCHLP